MAEIKWSNVDGSNMNTALGHLVQTNNTMYDRVKDLNQGLQSHLSLMQEGLNDQHKYQTELNTDMVLNQLASAQSQEDIDRLTKLGLVDANALQSQYGAKIDLSKINQAKASWVADVQKRAENKDLLKDTTEHAKSIYAQIEFLANNGKSAQAMELLKQNAGVFSNRMHESLNKFVNDRFLADREALMKSKLTDAQVLRENALAREADARTEKVSSETKILNLDDHNKRVDFVNNQLNGIQEDVKNAETRIAKINAESFLRAEGLGDLTEGAQAERVRLAIEQSIATGDLSYAQQALKANMSGSDTDAKILDNALVNLSALIEKRQKDIATVQNANIKLDSLRAQHNDYLNFGLYQNVSKSVTTSNKNLSKFLGNNGNIDGNSNGNYEQIAKEQKSLSANGVTVSGGMTSHKKIETHTNNPTNSNVGNKIQEETINSEQTKNGNISSNSVDHVNVNTETPNIITGKIDAPATNERLTKVIKSINDSNNDMSKLSEQQLSEYNKVLEDGKIDVESKLELLKYKPYTHSSSKINKLEQQYDMIKAYRSSGSLRYSRIDEENAKKALQEAKNEWAKVGKASLTKEDTDVTNVISKVDTGITDRIKEINEERKKFSLHAANNDSIQKDINLIQEKGIDVFKANTLKEFTEAKTPEEKQRLRTTLHMMELSEKAYQKAKKSGEIPSNMSFNDYIKKTINSNELNLNHTQTAEMSKKLGSIPTQLTEGILKSAKNSTNKDNSGTYYLIKGGKKVEVPFEEWVDEVNATEIQDYVNSGSYGIIDPIDRLYDKGQASISRVLKKIKDETDPDKKQFLMQYFTDNIQPLIEEAHKEGNSKDNTEGKDSGWSKAVTKVKTGFEELDLLANKMTPNMVKDTLETSKVFQQEHNNVKGNTALAIQTIAQKHQSGIESAMQHQRLNKSDSSTMTGWAARSTNKELYNSIKASKESLSRLGEDILSIMPKGASESLNKKLEGIVDEDEMLSIIRKHEADIQTSSDNIGNTLFDKSDYDKELIRLKKLAEIAKIKGFTEEEKEYDAQILKVKAYLSIIEQYNDKVQQKRQSKVGEN